MQVKLSGCADNPSRTSHPTLSGLHKAADQTNQKPWEEKNSFKRHVRFITEDVSSFLAPEALLNSWTVWLLSFSHTTPKGHI